MRDPSDLPLELFDLILSHLLYPDFLKLHRQINQLGILSLIDRRWSSAITPRMYADWYYSGADHSFDSLWCFFRTIVNNPRLARLVRSVDVDGRYHGHVQNIIPDQMHIIAPAIREAGLQHLEGDFIQALGDPETISAALTAILLTYLPNLAKLVVSVPRNDRLLPMVFNMAGRVTPTVTNTVTKESRSLVQQADAIQPHARPFQNLEQVLIMGFRESNPHLLAMAPMFNIFLFPRLRKLHFHGVTPNGLACILPSQCAGASPITHLTFSCSRMVTTDKRDIEAMLAIPKALENIDLFLGVPACCSSPNPIQLLTHSPTFWSVVVRHRDSLRSLNFYQAGLYRRSKNHNPVSRDMIRSLPRLTRLTSVSLPYQLLPSPARDLPRILPSVVTSLGLYKSHSDEDGLRSLDLPLSEMIRDRKFPALRSLSLADRVEFTPRTRDACRELDIHCSYYTPASSYYF